MVPSLSSQWRCDGYNFFHRAATGKKEETFNRSSRKKMNVWMLRLFRSLSRFETQDIKTQPQFNHYLIPYVWG